MTDWIPEDIPSQAGKLAVVTGATGGLGFETARVLAEFGAEVVVAGRNVIKGRSAISRVKDRNASANVRFETLDLANLGSIAAFAGGLVTAGRPLDLLVNNGGVMTSWRWQATDDGFERQFGTNYLGHFALTAHLLPLLRLAAKPRVVNVGSLSHRQAVIDFADLQSKRCLLPWTAYSRSKLAMLMFAFELQRRSDIGGWRVTSMAAHPGWARTNLFVRGPGNAGLMGLVSRYAAAFFSQSAVEGALPILFAATSPDAKAGGYYGPSGFHEMKGAVGPAYIAAQASDPAACAQLWDVSERLIGVSLGALPRATGSRWPH